MKATPFRAAFERLGPIFFVVTAAVYVYVWVKYPTFTSFMNHLFPYQLPVLIAHVVVAYVTAGTHQRQYKPGPTDDEWDDFGDWPDIPPPTVEVPIWGNSDLSETCHEPTFNINGLPMLVEGFDIHGNPYGTDFND